MRRRTRSRLYPALDARKAHCSTLPHAHVAHTNDAISTFLLFDEYCVSLAIFHISPMVIGLYVPAISMAAITKYVLMVQRKS
ncbi:hypothetical protein ALC62_06044 [Cyphomyrmex costatus]|uniref:Uncharacterized protein n=1 Tax=Cyphomyrmex costatus TaxID=456900 RepID=A0A195CRQ7_9HYME|nr:hypothetical protein ALC62_06044 [Cyphomyrmex costatus]